MSNLRGRLKRLEADQPSPAQRTLDWHALATEGVFRWDDGTPFEDRPVPTECPYEAIIAEEINSGRVSHDPLPLTPDGQGRQASVAPVPLPTLFPPP